MPVGHEVTPTRWSTRLAAGAAAPVRSGFVPLVAVVPLAAAAVEETLRWNPPVQETARVAFVDTEVGGVTVRSADLRSVLTAAGLGDVVTVLASGNAVVTARSATAAAAVAEAALEELTQQAERVHAQMAEAATDPDRLAELTAQERDLRAQHDAAEAEWLEAAEQLE